MKSSEMKLYFATDIHGSQRCFNKFINAGKFYGANVLVMGGDITGKSVLFLCDHGNGNYVCNFVGKDYEFSTRTELDDFMKLVKSGGYYPCTATQDEIDTYLAKPEEMDKLFSTLMRSSLEEWIAFAETRLNGTGIRCYMMAGNDDPDEVDDFLRNSGSEIVENPEGHVVRLDDWHEMVGCGFSNRTPWNSPRECDEDELKQKIDVMMSDVQDPAHCVLVVHVPPYGSGLDDAPVLLDEQRVKSSMGQVEFAPAGSTAVLAAIKQYGFQLSLHGHIHEAHAVKKIGNTIAINPGSDYGEGTLHGALITFRQDKLKNYQLVSG